MIVSMRFAVLFVLSFSAFLSPAAFAAEQAKPVPPAPAGIAVDSDGNVYVSDYALDRVVKFGPEGTVLAQWGSSGSALGQFNSPFGVALDAASRGGQRPPDAEMNELLQRREMSPLFVA